ncbi:hypothetical protein [Streptomyces ficellus]|uniref:Uncharacterized protein n=1 Tax=Streptomyces ficellus TaxID=1977088 RepID=A0A6I6F5B5_9ACTN|nr:hypothetical protein [Streptomyces ficellus]QGV78840.1 hypothetical protein EIZ62_11710 [Streptomyces ficellus]
MTTVLPPATDNPPSARPLPLSRLVRAEIRHLLTPRPVRWFLYALAPLLLLYCAAAFTSHHTDMSAAWSAAEEAHRRYAADGVRRPAGTWEKLSPDYFFDDPRYQMVKASFVDLRAIGSGLAVAALVLGVFSGGRDWSSRVMLTLAAAEPRRFRLFAVRGLLVTAVSAVLSLLAATLLVPLLVVVAHVRGTLAGADTHYWTVLAAIALRGALLIGLVAAIGYGLGMLTRSLTTALGIALAYLVVAERLVQDYATALTELHLSAIVFAVFNERLLMAVERTDCVGDIACAAMREGTTATQAFAGLTLYLLPVLAAAAWRFVRRDIT